MTPVRRPSRSARAFTLLEVMLTAVLGVLFMLAALGMFSLISQQDSRQRVHVEETVELSRTQEAMERAFQMLILSDSAGARPGSTSATGSTTAAANGSTPAASGGSASSPNSSTLSVATSATLASGGANGASSTGSAKTDSSAAPNRTDAATAALVTTESAGARPITPPAAPRLLLESDPAQGMRMWTLASGDQPVQRLEVAVRAAPAFAKAPDDAPARRRAPEPKRTGLSPDTSDTTNAAPQEWEIADGVRGAFELTRDEPQRGDTRPTWILWWRPIASAATAVIPDAAPADSDSLSAPPAPEPVDMGRARLASGLVECRWDVYRKREWLSEASATSSQELPAYVRLKVQTRSGTRHEWLFEVGWSTGAEPGTVVMRRGSTAPPPTLRDVPVTGTPTPAAGAAQSTTATGATGSKQ
ncbi:MAG: hypothetical protein KF745_07115 [Phycisphaeraceae bacterium]|nr:hypothetical protein [Phycisphaeraceae bacterium]